MLNRDGRLRKIKVEFFLVVLLLGLTGQELLIQDTLLAHFRQESKVSDSVDTALPSNHFSFILVHQNVFVGKIWLIRNDWLTHLPNVALCPSHMAFESFPGSKLRDGTQNADALSRDRFIEDFEI